MKPWMTMAGCALLQCAALSAQAAPDLYYLQNGLDGRGRCLATHADTVAMAACAKSPDQQWAVSPGDLPGYDKLRTAGAGEMFCLAAHPDEHPQSPFLSLAEGRVERCGGVDELADGLSSLAHCIGHRAKHGHRII